MCSLLYPPLQHLPLAQFALVFHTLFLYSFILLHTKDILRLGTKKGREKKDFVGNKKKDLLAKKKFWVFIFFSQYVQKIYKNLQKFVRLQKKNEFFLFCFDFKLVIYAIYICIMHTHLYNICGCVCVLYMSVCCGTCERQLQREGERKRRQEVLLQSPPPALYCSLARATPF